MNGFGGRLCYSLCGLDKSVEFPDYSLALYTILNDLVTVGPAPHRHLLRVAAL